MAHKHKTVLITGCSSGIGRLLVTYFLENHWRVIATMRNSEERKSLLDDDARAHGSRLNIQSLDVTDPAQREAVAQSVPSTGLDCLVNNAGYAQMGALETCDEDQIRAQLEVDLIAPMLMTRTLLPEIRKAHGTIINVSSMMGFTGFPLSSAYCASKGGLSMFSEALFHELKPIGVHVALVEPGGFRTNFAESTKWGNQPIAAYEKLTSDGQKVQARLSSGKGKSPKLVAERILKIADGEIKSARSRVGIDAVFSALCSALIPNSVRIALTSKFFEWYFARASDD